MKELETLINIEWLKTNVFLHGWYKLEATEQIIQHEVQFVLAAVVKYFIVHNLFKTWVDVTDSRDVVLSPTKVNHLVVWTKFI